MMQETEAIKCFFVPLAHQDIDDNNYELCKSEVAEDQHNRIKPTLSWKPSGPEADVADVNAQHVQKNRAVTHPVLLQTNSAGCKDKHCGHGVATNNTALEGSVAKTGRSQPLHQKSEDEVITV
jgi:hypothetical protein